MRITNIELIPWVMPKMDKEWRFALAAVPDSDGVLIRIETGDGIEGIAYTSGAAHVGGTQKIVIAGLEHLRPSLVGRDPFDSNAILADLDRALVGNNFAKAGIDMALHDLRARALGVPVYQLLGGQVRSQIPMLRIVPIKTPALMAANAQTLVDEGYRYLKIKVEGDVGEDVARIRAIREQVGSAVHLTIDANQSYSVKNAIRAITRMEPYDVELVEQPVNVDDLEGLAQVTRAVDVTVEADESAGTVSDIFRLVGDRVVDSVSLKIPKLGGLRNAQIAAGICQAGGVQCRLGAAVGSRLLAAACMHFVAATPNVSYACELGEFARLLDDPAEGLEVEDGMLCVPTGVGLGVSLRSRVAAGA